MFLLIAIRPAHGRPAITDTVLPFLQLRKARDFNRKVPESGRGTALQHVSSNRSFHGRQCPEVVLERHLSGSDRVWRRRLRRISVRQLLTLTRKDLTKSAVHSRALFHCWSRRFNFRLANRPCVLSQPKAFHPMSPRYQPMSIPAHIRARRSSRSLNRVGVHSDEVFRPDVTLTGQGMRFHVSFGF